MERKIYNSVVSLGEQVLENPSGDEVIDKTIMAWCDELPEFEKMGQSYDPLDVLNITNKFKELRKLLEPHRGEKICTGYKHRGILCKGQDKTMFYGTLAEEGDLLIWNYAWSISINTGGEHWEHDLFSCKEARKVKGDMDYYSKDEYKFGKSAEHAIEFCTKLGTGKLARIKVGKASPASAQKS